MTWDHRLPGCFGNIDGLFAIHWCDEERAFDWLVTLRSRKIGWEEAKAQIEGYLKDDGCGADHIVEQVSAAEKKLRPWLAP